MKFTLEEGPLTLAQVQGFIAKFEEQYKQPHRVRVHSLRMRDLYEDPVVEELALSAGYPPVDLLGYEPPRSMVGEVQLVFDTETPFDTIIIEERDD